MKEVSLMTPEVCLWPAGVFDPDERKGPQPTDMQTNGDQAAL